MEKQTDRSSKLVHESSDNTSFDLGSLKIREMMADPSELVQVFALEKKCFSEHAWKSLRNFKIRIDRKEAFIVFRQKEVIGYFFLKCCDGHLLLEKMAAKYKRQGIGSMILEFAQKFDRKIKLNVRETNSGARSLYKSFNFTEDGTTGEYNNGDKKISMEWSPK